MNFLANDNSLGGVSWSVARLRRYLRRALEGGPRFTLRKIVESLSRRVVWRTSYCVQRARRGTRARDRWFNKRKTQIEQTFYHFRQSGLFLAPTDATFVSDTLSERVPNYRQDVLRRANRIMSHRMPVLGYGQVDLGTPVNWQRDAVHDVQWPLSYSLTMNYVRPFQRCDVKIPWEVSRLQFLGWLGEAYCLTKETKYFRKFEDLLSHWDKSNPVGFGVNWTCPMEAAIRACNILFAMQLFQKQMQGRFAEDVYRLLWQHATFLRRHPEYSDVRGNHYIADLVGLIHLAAFFRPAREATRWLAWATEELFREIVQQFHPDGVHHEHSIGYHRLTLELVLAALHLLRRCQWQIPCDVMQRVRTALTFLDSYTLPDGSAPIIGDADSGRVLWFGEPDTNDHRYLLTLGAALCGDAPFVNWPVPASPAALWYLDQNSLRHAHHTKTPFPSVRRCQFPQGGFWVLNRGDSHAIVRCGGLGLRGRGLHDHNDQLSFHLHLAGFPLLVDSGNYTYTLSPDARRASLSTRAHNNVMIDGREQAGFATGSLMDAVGSDAAGTAIRCESDGTGSHFEGYHDGYARISGLGRQRRKLSLAIDGRGFLCSDYLDGSGRHDVELFFHLHPDAEVVELSGPQAIVRNGAGCRIRFHCDAGFDAVLSQGWYSAAYGNRQPAPVLCFSGRVELPASITTVISASLQT